jgi:excisionase family DNA binding protein
MDSDIMTMKEVAEYLKINDKTAYKLTKKGEIPAMKIGGTWRFKRSEIEKWVSTEASHKKVTSKK